MMHKKSVWLAVGSLAWCVWAWAAATTPTGLKSPRQTAFSVLLKWDTDTTTTNPIGYEIQRAPDQAGVPGNPTFLKRYTDAYKSTSYLDATASKDTTYHYRVRQTQSGFDGTEGSSFKSSWTDFLKVKTLNAPGDPRLTGVIIAAGKASSTTVDYELFTAGQVDIRVYTVDGVLVRTLVEAAQTTGQYSTTWDAYNMDGHQVASGTYLVHVKTPDQNVIKKIVVVR